MKVQSIINQIENEGITQKNYYFILGLLNTLVRPNTDIVTITGLMNWDEKLTHLNRYFSELKETV